MSIESAIVLCVFIVCIAAFLYSCASMIHEEDMHREGWQRVPVPVEVYDGKTYCLLWRKKDDDKVTT